MGLLRTLCISVFYLYATQVTAHTDPLHLDWIDKNASISDNFFAYANGNWQKNNPIPQAYARWGVFTQLDVDNQYKLRRLIEGTIQNSHHKDPEISQKIADFYRSGMDTQQIERLGITPLHDELEQIKHVKDTASLANLIAKLHVLGVNVLFNFDQMQDFCHSERVIGVLTQAGLGLPDRDYYLKPDAHFANVRALYRDHIIKMLQLSGEPLPQAKRDAQAVMAIETALAKASMPLALQRDPHAIYHMMSRKKLQKITPHFNWQRYFSELGYPHIRQLNLAMPAFFQQWDQLLINVPLTDWQSYLRWHLLHTTAPYLSSAFVNEQFHLVQALTGKKILLPRWQRVVEKEDHVLGFALGKLYVEQFFSPAAKKAVEEMTDRIRHALASDLRTLTWMSPTTRERALKKLSLMEARIGYPEKWRDYHALVINRDAYVRNVLRAHAFLNRYEWNKIGKPLDRNEWEMTPQMVNAYYDPSMNNLNIPAGILQPPFFDLNAPTAVNYGAIGFIIGHEMTHGFDDQGARFDGYGNLRNWWTAADLKKFHAATTCIVKQFSRYTVLDNLHLQGKLVAGEAIADLGGLLLAYRAFHLMPLNNDLNDEKCTADQTFFLSAAHIWASNIRPEELYRLVTVDPHPPALYRVNGTFANIPAFQKAYHLPNTSQMVNTPRCVIW